MKNCTELELMMLIHYYCIGEDFRGLEYPSQRRAIERFKDEELIALEAPGCRRTYRLTEKGKVFVKALMAVPFPVCEWRVPIVETSNAPGA